MRAMPSFRSAASRKLSRNSNTDAAYRSSTDESEFARLFRANYADLCSFVQSYVESRPIAEELVQELFLNAWERNGPITRSYLFTAARNGAISHLRRERLHARWAQRTRDEDSNKAHERPAAEADVEYAALCERVDAEIARLPERCRLVFTMNRQQNLSYAEIAGLLGVSVKAVEAQMGRALRALRDNVLPLLVTSAACVLIKGRL